MRRFITALVVGLAACFDGNGLTGVEGTLAVQRAAWIARGLEDYDVDLRHGSAWTPMVTVRIEVRDGLAVSARDVETNAPLALEWQNAWTVDSVFERAAYFAAQPGFNLTLRFHPALSYPMVLYIDHPGWADEEQYFEIVRLTGR